MSIGHISKRWSAAIVAAAGLLVSGATTTANLAQQPASESPRVTVGDDGTVWIDGPPTDGEVLRLLRQALEGGGSMP